MKKHLLSLIAVAFLAIGITACSNAKSSDDSKGEKTENKDDLKDPDSVGTTFVDLLNDCIAKINASQNEEDLAEARNQFEQVCAEFQNDEAELSDAERSEIINAMAELSIAVAVKSAEFQGQSLPADQIDMVKNTVRNRVESACGNSRNIKELLSSF